MAKCIEKDIIEIIPLQCPPLQNITCQNNQNKVLVYDENNCCKKYVCDCFCQGWGDPHYITFDGLSYSYQGNCTYILMEEISPKYHLKIYIDSVYCDIREPVSCPRSIIVSYNKQVITLWNHKFISGVDLEARKDSVKLRLPYTHNGVRVVSTSLNLLLEIPELNVVVKFGKSGFSINLPFQYFGKNTQGHCGTCNNNKTDDCMLPGGTLVNDCAVMADYWPASGVDGKNCTNSTSPPVTSCLDSKPHPDCSLLETKVFEACHSHVPPKNFFLACQYDYCRVKHHSVVCASLESYASACSQLGICIHWRNYTNLCNISCPTNKIFLPCGPSEPLTCRDGPPQSNISVPTEGCFCPQNTTLFNKESGLCVSNCGCMDPSGTPREFGKQFKYNCEDCVCDKASTSVICKPKKCPDVNPESCTEPGFMLFNVTDPSDPCCSKQVCNCNVSKCPPLDEKCAVGYLPVLEVPKEKCCPEIRCEPKTVCVHNNTEYQPGTKIPTELCVECNCEMDKNPQTQLHIVKCSPKVCPKNTCPQGFEYVKKDKECCGTCTQVACIYDAPDNTKHTLEHGKVDYYTCETVTCLKVNNSFVSEKIKTECPSLSLNDCGPGFEYVKKYGECCGSCTQVGCIYDAPGNTRHALKAGEEYKYKCETVSCSQVNGSFVTEKTNTECPYLSSEDCGPGFEYVKNDEECCGTCTQVACIYDAPDNTAHTLEHGKVDYYTCETVTCLKVNNSFVSEKIKTECPSLSSNDCGPGFEYVKKDGECCGSCTQVGCIYDAPGNTRHALKAGEEYKYKCETVSCRQVNGSFVTEKIKTECPYLSSEDCGPGFEYVKKDEECCGSCTQVGCIYDAPDNITHVLKDGMEYNFKCMNASCMKSNGMFVTIKTLKQCPPFNPDDCEPGTVQLDKDGCCKICKPSNCVLVKNITRLHVTDCTSIVDVEVNSCTGHCDDGSMYSMENNMMMHKCSCCQEENFNHQQVTLKCANSSEISYFYKYVKSCKCTPTNCVDKNNSG